MSAFFLTSKVMHLLSVLFAVDVGLAPKLQEVFDKWKQILVDHGLREMSQKLSTVICYLVTHRSSVDWLQISRIKSIG